MDQSKDTNCPVCGTVIHAGMTECPLCGAAIETASTQAPKAEAKPVEPAKTEKAPKTVKPAEVKPKKTAPPAEAKPPVEKSVAKKPAAKKPAAPASGPALVSLSDSLQVLIEIANEYEKAGNLQGALETYRKALDFAERHRGDDPSIRLAVQTLGILIQRTEQMLGVPAGSQETKETTRPEEATIDQSVEPENPVAPLSADTGAVPPPLPAMAASGQEAGPAAAVLPPPLPGAAISKETAASEETREEAASPAVQPPPLPTAPTAPVEQAAQTLPPPLPVGGATPPPLPGAAATAAVTPPPLPPAGPTATAGSKPVGTPPGPQQVPPRPKKSRAGLIVGIVLGSLVVLAILGTIGALLLYPAIKNSGISQQLQPPTAAATVAPTSAIPPTASGPVTIHWFVGLGTGSDPSQVPAENAVVDDFNQLQSHIHLVMDVIPNASARDTLSTQIAAGNGPDVVGPIGWAGSNAFYGQWLDLSPYLQAANYDSSDFNPALVKMYQTEEGTVALPFAVYPSAIYYNPRLFQRAGLNPPPARYGDLYRMPNGSTVEWSWDTLTQVAKMLTLDSSGRNALSGSFNRNAIVQYGFSFGWEGHPIYWGSFWQSGAILQPGGSPGNYSAQIPSAWKEAWQWVYDGMWGSQPYIPPGGVAGSGDFDSGNVFASGKIAMLENPSWYVCCIGDLTNAGGTFDFGAMPTYQGQVAGRVDADSFRIWKGTQHPVEAFQVLAYLVGQGSKKLIIGSSDLAAPYGLAVPGRTSYQADWLNAERANYSFVKNWDVLLAGLSYPDSPSAESYMPNYNEAWTRLQTFGDRLSNNYGLNLQYEESQLVSDLNSIFNK